MTEACSVVKRTTQTILLQFINNVAVIARQYIRRFCSAPELSCCHFIGGTHKRNPYQLDLLLYAVAVTLFKSVQRRPRLSIAEFGVVHFDLHQHTEFRERNNVMHERDNINFCKHPAGSDAAPMK